MSSGRRIRGSKFIGEVIATETNLEVISLRIFKSMGTDEITREEGSRERRRNPGPNSEEPQEPCQTGVSGVTGLVCSRHHGIPDLRAAPGSHQLLALWGSAGEPLQGERKWGEAGRGKGCKWPPGCTSSVQEMEDREAAIGFGYTEWLSPLLRALRRGGQVDWSECGDP